MSKLLNKIKQLLNLTRLTKTVEKITALEQRVLSLEKANILILTRLLQNHPGNPAKISGLNTKLEDKNEFLLVSHKDLNARKTPTYH